MLTSQQEREYQKGKKTPPKPKCKFKHPTTGNSMNSSLETFQENIAPLQCMAPIYGTKCKYETIT
ncbi:hypothetical protein DV515_00008325 [Chloebia gouldiae]|uniref:Uncharacterized protein n=1 Tax=Chloebia gouldiae TaxID=44316 RepID=A0A3L8SEV5_CHLGU|nr:hypothetical protein DV515_00008325 [Chloebia gouldiae]